MTTLPIYVIPQPVLKKKADPVGAITPEITKLLDDMLETMYAARGIGLAAPQIGISKRVIVMDVEQDEAEEGKINKPGNPICMIDPEIIWSSEEMNIYKEGCLSIPDQYADIERPEKVKVSYTDRDGKKQEVEADGLLSTCIQHEIDHINGILFTDHLSSLKRDMILRKVKKWAKDNAEHVKFTHVL